VGVAAKGDDFIISGAIPGPGIILELLLDLGPYLFPILIGVYAERIFKMFQRLHGRDSYEGTGIGLAIVQRIAERHGGAVRVDATPGGGSTFVMTVPDRAGIVGRS